MTGSHMPFRTFRVLNWRQFCPRDIWEHLEIFFGCHNARGQEVGKATSIYWAQAGMLIKHPIMHRTVATTNDFLVQNENSAKVTKA